MGNDQGTMTNVQSQEKAAIEQPTPNMESVGNGEAMTTTRTKNRNDEGMAMGALCLFVPPDGSGGLGSPGKTPTSNVGADLAGAVHDALVALELWARFCAMRFWTAAAGTGSNVCCTASRARAFGKLFTDFQLFPLISTCFRSFDNKNIFKTDSRSPGKFCRPCGGLGWIPWIVTSGNA